MLFIQIGDKSFKNKAGYYLIEGPNHTITGTSDLLMCQRSGTLFNILQLHFL